MHLNFYFLKQLSAKLNRLLNQAVFIEAFSQQKNELILVFELKDKSIFYIRATLTNTFSCLSFPADFKRSRKNSVNLFDELFEDRVYEIHQFENERAFSIQFKSGFALLFKLHGNRSNIILTQDTQALKIFKSELPNDLNIRTEQLDRKLEKSRRDFLGNPEFKVHFPTYGKVVGDWLNNQGYAQLNAEDQWELLIKAESLLEMGEFYLYRQGIKPLFSLLPFDTSERLDSNPIVAINDFYYQFSKVYFLESNKAEKLQGLLKKKKQLESYIQKSEQKLESLKEGPKPGEIGDIIMANLHNIAPALTKVSLFNFYTNSDITIRLNSKLSPQKNAENYYRKGKNRKIEEDKILENIESKKRALAETKELINLIKQVETNKELTKISKEHNLLKSFDKPEVSLPYREFTVNGFRVWVGKNAKSNDELTLKFRHKEDLWLHAKDVPGSHVLIKYQSNKAFDSHTIEKVAEIAAYYSKRKTDSLAPVVYTPAKHVRKRKGSPAGMVVVEKESVLIVPPRNPAD